MKDGNQYVLMKPYTTESGKTMDTGAICHYKAGNLYGYDSTNTYIEFAADRVPESDIFLYEETPFNKEQREKRERISTAILGSMVNAMMINTVMLEQLNSRAYRENFPTLGAMLADDAVRYADELVKRLIKED